MVKLIAICIIVYFLMQFYKEYSANQRVADANQMAYDKEANAQYIASTKPEEYEDWEVAANAILDPANILGFR